MNTEEIVNEILKLGKQATEIKEKMKSLCEEYAKKMFPFEKGEKVLVKDTYTDKEIPGFFVGATASYNSFRNEMLAFPILKKAKKDGSISQVSFGYLSASDEDLRLGRFHIRPFVEQ